MGRKKKKQKYIDCKQNITEMTECKDAQIEYALKAMDRTDEWINSCDNKLSILLGICGVVLTVCITSESINKGYKFVKETVLKGNNIYSCLFILACLITVIFYLKFIYHIVNALLVRVDSDKFKQEELTQRSNLFFGTISSRKYKEYKSDFLKNTPEERLNDILSQVYINSSIAKLKHKQYNNSLLWMGISVIATLAIIVFGIIAF
ncbi:hypothetical protein [Butyrivibrio fibrisolvens]|uniref:hypothetical protein n=1 Tax=Butyrivibrio fibrisolvens TaxID=831 RepID=UPI0004241A71|nr:hypothetical protein [Butyrivibrio fibrisolvens]